MATLHAVQPTSFATAPAAAASLFACCALFAWNSRKSVGTSSSAVPNFLLVARMASALRHSQRTSVARCARSMRTVHVAARAMSGNETNAPQRTAGTVCRRSVSSVMMPSVPSEPM